MVESSKQRDRNGFISYDKVLRDLRYAIVNSKRDFQEKRNEFNGMDQKIYESLFSLSEDTLNSQKNAKFYNLNKTDMLNDVQKDNILDQTANFFCKHPLFGTNWNDANFTTMNDLTYDSYHQDVHSTKRHYCNHAGCTKSYTSNHGLKYHIAHGHKKSQEIVLKPFVCPIIECNKNYRNSNGLKYHMRKVHPGFGNY